MISRDPCYIESINFRREYELTYVDSSFMPTGKIKRFARAGEIFYRLNKEAARLDARKEVDGF